MLDGPIELSIGDDSIRVYRKMYDGEDAYAIVGSRYAAEHPDEVTDEKIERIIDDEHARGCDCPHEQKQMWRELFEVFGA